MEKSLCFNVSTFRRFGNGSRGGGGGSSSGSSNSRIFSIVDTTRAKAVKVVSLPKITPTNSTTSSTNLIMIQGGQ